MRLTQINEGKIKVLHNLIAYKWLKLNKTNKDSLILLPDSILEPNDARLGHRFLCQAIAIGPEVTEVKVGDKFILHEYSKTDQGTAWDERDIMFCEERDVLIKVGKDFKGFSIAPKITKEMEDYYNAHEDVEIDRYKGGEKI